MNEGNIWIYCIIYIILTIAFLSFLRTKRQTKAPGYKGVVFGMLIYYVIIPFFVILNAQQLNELEFEKGKYCSYTIQRFILGLGNKEFLYAILMAILAFACFNLFYKISFIKEDTIVYNIKKTDIIVKILMWITFIVGSISLIIFFSSLGGIRNALQYAEYARSFENQLSELAKGSAIFIISARLITVTPFLAIFLLKNSDKKNIYKLILVISMILSILYFLFNAGRTILLAFLLCFAYMILSKKVKKAWTLIICVGIVALPILDVLDAFFIYLNTGIFNMNSSSYLSYILQLSYPYKNTLAMSQITDMYGLHYGKDLIAGILNLLPGVSFDASYIETSLYMRGADWKSLGGIPNDFITFAYLQFSFIGVIIISSILGFIMQIVDKKLSLFPQNDSKRLFEAVITIYSFFLIGSADFENVIKGFILVFIIFIIMLSTRKE